MAVPDDEGERAGPGQDTWAASQGHVGAPAPPTPAAPGAEGYREPAGATITSAEPGDQQTSTWPGPASTPGT
jgi:hypothetical protein